MCSHLIPVKRGKSLSRMSFFYLFFLEGPLSSFQEMLIYLSRFKSVHMSVQVPADCTDTVKSFERLGEGWEAVGERKEVWTTKNMPKDKRGEWILKKWRQQNGANVCKIGNTPGYDSKSRLQRFWHIAKQLISQHAFIMGGRWGSSPAVRIPVLSHVSAGRSGGTERAAE